MEERSTPDSLGRRRAESFRVLVVDDERLFAQAIDKELRRHKIACDLAFCAREALDMCHAQGYRAILLDHKLPDDDGIRLIPILLGSQQKCQLVMMTAYETIDNAIQAIRQGADDYVVKETRVDNVISRILEIFERDKVLRRGCGWDEHKKDGPTGRSAVMGNVRDKIVKVASQRTTTVLFEGETGVGKEVAARFLHSLTEPNDGPFVSVDCVALPANLVESLLFGHEKGAFTGAHQARRGAFEEAGRGTILLDEIGDMDLVLQGKLLRVLENRKYQRVGSVKEYDVNARIVAATNRDLMELVKAGRFRFDLYQRLTVFPIHIPPLRERGDDILLTAMHFVEFLSEKMNIKIEALSKEVQERLLAYDYPGNVRELKNAIERAIIMTDSGKIELRHLPERMLGEGIYPGADRATLPSNAIDFIPGVDTMETVEEKLINHALTKTNGAKGEAARLLGISRFQLLRKIQKYQKKYAEEEHN